MLAKAKLAGSSCIVCGEGQFAVFATDKPCASLQVRGKCIQNPALRLLVKLCPGDQVFQDWSASNAVKDHFLFTFLLHGDILLDDPDYDWLHFGTVYAQHLYYTHLTL